MNLKVSLSRVAFAFGGLLSCDIQPNTGHQIYHSYEDALKTGLISYRLTAPRSYIDIENRIKNARVKHCSEDGHFVYHGCRINRLDERTLTIEVGPITTLLKSDKYFLEYTFDGTNCTQMNPHANQ